MNINIKQINDTFFRIIKHLSDKEYQRRVWISGEGPEVDEFDETVNNFSDLWDIMFEKHKEFGITDEQYDLLKRFQIAFKTFYDEQDWPPEFIDTPEWEHIMSMAKEVLKAFGRL